MVCSPEQLASNRRNSKLSTGPSTPLGKSISRKNGLKHGLTGAGVVIADEDVAALEERFAAFEADLKPANDVARFLVGRASLLSVRLDRSAREEAARITLDMLEAEELEEDIRLAEFEDLIKSLPNHPVDSVRKLRRSEEGIDWLLNAWRMARSDLFYANGCRWRSETVGRLTGLQPLSPLVRRLHTLTLAQSGSLDYLEPTDWPDLPPVERQAAAQGEIVAIIDREIAGLEEARKNLDRDKIAQSRAGAAARAIFSASKDDTLARRYEAANERGFYKALKQIEAINATVQESTEAEETQEQEETCDELASSFPAEVGQVNRIARIEERDRQEASGELLVAGGQWSGREKDVPITDN